MTADNGDIKSMLDCGRILSQGNGILVDKKESAKKYKMAADLGNEVVMTT